MQQRIAWIDCAKGIAILCVVLGHVVPSEYFITKAVFIFHLPIFFILSGYLYHPKTIRWNLNNGIQTLLLPYMSTCLILFLFYFLSIKYPDVFFTKYSSIREMLIGFGYGAGVNAPINPWGFQIEMVGAIWFLLSMFVTQQIFNLCITISKGNTLFQLCLISFFVAFGLLISPKWLMPWTINGAFIALGFVYFGFLMKQHDWLAYVNGYILAISVLLWILAAKFSTLVLVNGTMAKPVLSFWGGIFASILVIAFSKWLTSMKRLRILQKTLRFYGRNSLIILCFHLVDLNVFVFYKPLFVAAQDNMPLFFVYTLTYFVRLILPTFAALTIRKLPFIRNFYLHREFPFTRKPKSSQ